MRCFVCAGMGANPTQNMKADAAGIGRLLGQNGHTLIQGGSDHGLMGVTLGEFLRYSQDVEMIVPEVYKSDLNNLIYKKAHITKDIAGRLKAITELSDKIVVLAGGTGTLLELLYANESSRASEHTSDIICINTDGYFNGLKQQIETMTQYGFTNQSKFMVQFTDNIQGVKKLNTFSMQCKPAITKDNM